MRGFLGILVCVLLAASVHAEPSRLPHGVESPEITRRGADVMVESTLVVAPFDGGAMFAATNLPIYLGDDEHVETVAPLAGTVGARLRLTNEYMRANGAIVISQGGLDLASGNAGSLAGGADVLVMKWAYSAATNPITITYVAAPLLPQFEDTNDVPILAAPPIISELEFYTLADTSLAERVTELRDQVLRVDDPVGARDAANKAYADQVANSAYQSAHQQIYQREGATDLAGNPLQFSPRYEVVGVSNDLQIKYGGYVIGAFEGGNAAIQPAILDWRVNGATQVTMTVRTSELYLNDLSVQWSSNWWGGWATVATNVITRQMLDEYTARLVITMAVDNLGYLRLLDGSGAIGAVQLRVQSLHVLDDVMVGGRIYLGSTNVWIGYNEQEEVVINSTDGTNGGPNEMLLISGQTIRNNYGGSAWFDEYTVRLQDDAQFGGLQTVGLQMESIEGVRFLNTGHMYYDSTNDVLKVWSGSAWKNFSPVP
ncbi:MAG: hypothetical protein M5U15_13730 [Kiritimatiellae bacterium]|nr:hypothetical protein [Kiritimatiellia bacterium]